MLAAPVTRATTGEEKAGARAAAAQGEAAYEASHWAEAVDLFSRAESLVHSPVHLLFKARALAKLGQLVNARETYEEIIHEQPPVPSPTLIKAQEAAKIEDQALEPRLAKITIKVDGPGAANASVLMDGAAVPNALIGLSYPVDPGEHHFRASTAGTQSNVASISLPDGGAGTVTLSLPVAAAAPAVAAATGTGVVASAGIPDQPASSAAPGGANAARSDGSGLRIGAYVAFGVGVVGLAVGTGFALKAKSKYNDADTLCPTSPCTLTTLGAAQRANLRSQGDSARNTSLIGFIVGGAAVATGVTLLILSSSKSQSDRAGVRAWVGLGSLGLDGIF